MGIRHSVRDTVGILKCQDSPGHMVTPVDMGLTRNGEFAEVSEGEVGVPGEIRTHDPRIRNSEVAIRPYRPGGFPTIPGYRTITSKMLVSCLKPRQDASQGVPIHSVILKPR